WNERRLSSQPRGRPRAAESRTSCPTADGPRNRRQGLRGFGMKELRPAGDPLLAPSRLLEVVPAPLPPEPLRISRMLSASSLAARLDVSRAWVRDWHRRGLLRGIVLRPENGKGRGRLLFRESDVLEFLAARGIELKSKED